MFIFHWFGDYWTQIATLMTKIETFIFVTPDIDPWDSFNHNVEWMVYCAGCSVTSSPPTLPRLPLSFPRMLSDITPTPIHAQGTPKFPPRDPMSLLFVVIPTTGTCQCFYCIFFVGVCILESRGEMSIDSKFCLGADFKYEMILLPSLYTSPTKNFSFIWRLQRHQ